MNTQKRTLSNIAPQPGKTVIITGANSGLGLRAATVLGEEAPRLL